MSFVIVIQRVWCENLFNWVDMECLLILSGKDVSFFLIFCRVKAGYGLKLTYLSKDLS